VYRMRFDAGGSVKDVQPVVPPADKAA